MLIDCFVLGDLETNCYILHSQAKSGNCIIIDPGAEAAELTEFLQQRSLKPQRILLTHGHWDHIGGVGLVQKQFDPDIPVNISPLDAPMLRRCSLNLSAISLKPMKITGNVEPVNPGETIELDGIKLEVIATGGHTAGGLSFYISADKVVFTGDALFAGSIGRHDLPGGDLNTLLEGIRTGLFTLPGNTKVYPGHGPTTTIEREKTTNPFF